MFTRILIANRGEITCRIMRTCRHLGVQTVAVYSDADADALHVSMADQAVRLGPAPVADSYLRGDLIVQAALDTGAEAIHPGYGFLSENPEFVDAVETAGLVFIGPSAAAIRAMGLKDAAKKLMQAAGVPVVPGYLGDDQDADVLAQEAAKIGFPVLIKAVAGGGGKGMRLVENPRDFAEALDSARAEARTAFGNDAVLIEKYIQSPRHIEVQVFGDGAQAVHLFERDCSLQRRHQKVIEEAPAPGMTAAMRTAMGDAAVTAAKAIGYAGAGTIEFIVDASDGLRPDRFWFMEMNTRLQVEHPVTEAITGVDLVEWQMRVASGEPLPARQSDLRITGHAFETRLYAEDVPAGFLPATGRLDLLAFPAGLRADSGVRTGDTISPWYDPMIAKLIVHRPDRASALQALRDGLRATRVAGTVTNLGFLAALADHPGFAAGQVDTGLIGRDIASLTAAVPCPPRDIAFTAIVAAGLAELNAALTGFTLWAALARRIEFRLDGADRMAILRTDGPDRITVALDSQIVDARRGPDGWRLDRQAAPAFVRHGNRITVFGAATMVVEITDPLDRAVAAGPVADGILAPMPGLVRSIAVSVGDPVTSGDRMVVLEAMKMEHVLRAPRDGVIAAVHCVAGGQVTAKAVLIALEPQSDSAHSDTKRHAKGARERD